MTDDLMSVNILICYSFGDELGGNEITYITLKPYDFSLKQMADFNKFLSNKDMFRIHYKWTSFFSS